MTKISKTDNIQKDDKVLIIDGCYSGYVVKVLAVRPHRHFPVLVSLPNKEVAEYHTSQIRKIS